MEAAAVQREVGERREHQLHAIGQVRLLEQRASCAWRARVMLDRDDASAAVGAERRGEEHRGAAAAELHDELRPLATDQVEEKGRFFAGDLKTLVREGRDHAP